MSKMDEAYCTCGGFDVYAKLEDNLSKIMVNESLLDLLNVEFVKTGAFPEIFVLPFKL